MAKKKNRTRKDKSEISRSHETRTVTGKTGSRKVRSAARVQAKVKSQAVKTTPESQPQQTSAGVSRSEGIRLFRVAGRPTKEQFILVYGERGPRMTWDERAKAGVPAKQFQVALAAKLAENAVSRPAAAKPAPTTKQTPKVPLAGA
jgi:hypothetical protein